MQLCAYTQQSPFSENFGQRKPLRGKRRKMEGKREKENGRGKKEEVIGKYLK